MTDNPMRDIWIRVSDIEERIEMDITAMEYDLTRNEEKNKQMYEYYRLLAKSMLTIARNCVYTAPIFLGRYDSRNEELVEIRKDIAILMDKVDRIKKSD